MKPLATRKYSDASVNELSSVVKNSRSLSSIAQIANMRMGPPKQQPGGPLRRVTWRNVTRAPQVRSAAMSGCLAKHAILHHREQTFWIAQDREVRHRVAIDQQQVGQVAFLDLARSSPGFIMIWPPYSVAQRIASTRREARGT